MGVLLIPSISIFFCITFLLFSYMRRHPCILDRGNNFLDRHSWLYQAFVILFITLAVLSGSLMAFALQFTTPHLASAYTFVVGIFLFYAYTCKLDPGTPPICKDEASVIHLLHAWPISSSPSASSSSSSSSLSSCTSSS